MLPGKLLVIQSIGVINKNWIYHKFPFIFEKISNLDSLAIIWHNVLRVVFVSDIEQIDQFQIIIVILTEASHSPTLGNTYYPSV